MSPLVAVIADTHIPRRARALPEGLIPHLERVDLVLHAGDLMAPALLDELAACAPVKAVREDDADDLMLLNPGSPTDRRRQPHPTFALLHAEGDGVSAEIVALWPCWSTLRKRRLLESYNGSDRGNRR